MAEAEALAQKKKTLSRDDIIVSAGNESNKTIIYKFMKKGFTALTAEELAATLVNPTFSIDFKDNTGEDWNYNYQAKVMDKLQRCKFQMHWLNKQVSATGDGNQHEGFLAEVSRGKSIENIFMYLRKHDEKQVLQSVDPKSKRSPLHIAAKGGYMHLIELFLNKGADIEARDKLLKTPLHYACENGHA